MFDVAGLREQFPALSLKRGGLTPIFLDGPAGTQVPRSVVEAIGDCLVRTNANRGGLFAVSQDADAMLDRAHRAVADFLGADSLDEIAFGQNMTSLTFALSRALGRTWKPGDEVMVTRCDHDANVAPWLLAARDAGATVRWIDIDPANCTLDLDTFRRQLNDRTKLVAVGLASNLVGTIHPVAAIAREAKRVGALTFVDAVHHAPHGPISVGGAWTRDFLACSAYKFFGPHVGILWGRRELLESLAAYKVRPAPDAAPGKWMTGTQNHEGIAGTLAAVEYLNAIGMAAIRDYEKTLARRLLDGLATRPRFRIHGLGADRLDERVPTIAIADRHLKPRQIAEHLAGFEIYVWSGNSYALEVSERLGLEPDGIVRLGLVHYNTAAEVDALLEGLDRLPA